MSVDVREVVLASIRTDLVDHFDSGMLVFDSGVIDRRMESIAEHALDAAVARGASLTEVLMTADELLENGCPADSPHFEDGFDDVFDPDRGMTFGAVRRDFALTGLGLIALKLDMTAQHAVHCDIGRRMAMRGLCPETTADAVSSHEERRSIYSDALVGSVAAS